MTPAYLEFASKGLYNDRIELLWRDTNTVNVLNNIDYLVYRKTDTSEYEQVRVVEHTMGKTSYNIQDTDVIKNVTYTYKIVTEVSEGNLVPISNTSESNEVSGAMLYNLGLTISETGLEGEFTYTFIEHPAKTRDIKSFKIFRATTETGTGVEVQGDGIIGGQHWSVEFIGNLPPEGVIHYYYAIIYNANDEEIETSSRISIGHDGVVGLNDLFVNNSANPAKNYPNPFSTETTFEFEATTSGNYQLFIYDQTGNLVDESASFHVVSGKNLLNWNKSSNLTSGIYFYTIKHQQSAQEHTHVVRGSFSIN